MKEERVREWRVRERGASERTREGPITASACGTKHRVVERYSFEEAVCQAIGGVRRMQ